MFHFIPANVAPSTPSFIGGIVPTPVFDFPHGTTRAAVDLVVTKTLETHPNIKIILSHDGGTLPFILPRALTLFDAAPLGIDSADLYVLHLISRNCQC